MTSGFLAIMAGCSGDTGPAGAAGAAGSSCLVESSGGTTTIRCADGTTAAVANGSDGTSCSVSDSGSTKTISCADGTSVTIVDGADGGSCAVSDTGGGSVLISCDDGSSATVSDGSSCTVTDNGDGTKTIGCADGTTVTVADGAGLDFFATPTLEGHKAGGYLMPYDVQAAYNGDTFFWRLRYRGTRGDHHDYLRFTNGAWQKEGTDRRDTAATLAGDPIQGETTAHSTIYEQRTSIMVNDPARTPRVTNFDKFGCYVTCHNGLRHTPGWEDTHGEDTKWVDPAEVTGYAAGTADKVLDLWHWRGARSGPVAMADDQYIQAKTFVNTAGADDGGRKGDAGNAPFASNNLTGGNPDYVYDPATTFGIFAPKWEDFWTTPFYYFVQPDAQNRGPMAPNPLVMSWANATAAGYVPSEGDVVPRRILRRGSGSHGDITADGTHFTPLSADGKLGAWDVQLQRALATGQSDDVDLVSGQQYDVAFEVHTWEYTTRDHYISFPMKLYLGAACPGAPGEYDICATSVAGSGSAVLPNWNDAASFPAKRVYLFQPGIATWEFLSGQTTGLTMIDPVSGQAIDQTHGGAAEVSGATNGCSTCHTVKGGAMSMEKLAKGRGGIWAPTPVLQ